MLGEDGSGEGDGGKEGVWGTEGGVEGWEGKQPIKPWWHEQVSPWS